MRGPYQIRHSTPSQWTWYPFFPPRFRKCVVKALPGGWLWYARTYIIVWMCSIICYALHVANHVDQKIHHISLTASVSTRQNRSESSGVHGDNKRRFLFASYGQLPYLLVSFRDMAYFICLLLQTFDFGVGSWDAINWIFIFKFFKLGKIALT